MGHKKEDWIVVDRLTDIILSNVKGCVVEIGIGVSTEVLLKHTKKLGVVQYSCDTNRKKCNWARKIGVTEVYEGTSFNFIERFPDIPIALVLLDGDHRYPTVVKEVNFFLERLSLGGVIFMHDTCKTSWKDVYGKVTSDSYLVRRELEQREDLMTFTWPYDYGLTMVMKKEINSPIFRK